ncbi:MAG: type II toxin-antitoxin system HicB family antitoxin [Gammaproteobacteria bacterium]|nr:type II toxin-antitoxin system HicB family antitoxin [Gammaproteobacteria bacterium]
MRYAVVIEQGPASYGAYVPDLPGCVATAATREEVVRLIQEAIEFHIEGLRQDGQPVPPPSSSVEFVDVAA